MNDALALPFFTQPTSTYPPTSPFGDSYEGQFTTSQDEFYSADYSIDTDADDASLGLNPNEPRSRPVLASYPFPTPPGTSDAQGFHPASSSSSYISGFYTNPSFLDVASASRFEPAADQPGPSTYSRPSSAGDEYLQAPDDDDDDNEDALVKLEDGDQVENDDGTPLDEEVDNEEPLYVNAKQYHRILKRRAARQRLEELNRLARSRKPYLHESRHRHACSRPRGKGGRFLTAEEIEAMKKDQAAKAAAETQDDDGSDTSRPSSV